MGVNLTKLLLFSLVVYLVSLSMAQLYVVARVTSLLPKPFLVTDSAQISVALLDVAGITFTVSSLDFGQGFVNESCNNCTMDVEDAGTTDASCCLANWATPKSGGLLIENTGNVAVNLFMNVSSNASDWIGGDDVEPSFQFKMVAESADEHANAKGDDTSSSCASAWKPSSFFETNTTGMYVCGDASTFDFTPAASKDEGHLLVRIVIPLDATKGQKEVTFLALATSP